MVDPPRRTFLTSNFLADASDPARDDVEDDPELVADAHRAVEGGGRLDVEVPAADLELAAGAQVFARHRDARRYLDAARDAVQREVARDLDLKLSARRGINLHARAPESDLRVLVGLDDDLAQLFVDDLLLRLGENLPRLGERGGAG